MLCLRDGTVLGALPPFAVGVPWWPEAAPVVRAARQVHGVDVILLRLLAGDPARVPAGGPVAYLAEVAAPPDVELRPWRGAPTADEPLRLPWARPGGPDAELAWADAELVSRGTPRAGPAEQVRTWNLSSLWRLPVPGSSAWLKVVPPFFAHEGRLLARLQGQAVPELLAAETPRVLLAELPGPDHHDTVGEPLLAMVLLLVALQAGWLGREDELLALGLPDWRAEPLQGLAADTVRRTGVELDRPVVAALERLLDGLPGRFAEVAACGLPDGLVHGDFHRGNVRGPLGRLVLLDWGDAGVGHPLLDQAAFLDRLPEADRAAVAREWSSLWRRAVPGSDPDRAASLLAPVAALRQAVVYRCFLDGIEPDERVYHAADPAVWLARAADLSA